MPWQVEPRSDHAQLIKTLCLIQTTDDFAEKVEDLVNECRIKLGSRKKLNAFLNYLMKRRASKEGRFFRVHFKSGTFVDLVPPGSLASGETLVDRERG